jgi:hypothetical protein
MSSTWLVRPSNIANRVDEHSRLKRLCTRAVSLSGASVDPANLSGLVARSLLGPQPELA